MIVRLLALSALFSMIGTVASAASAQSTADASAQLSATVVDTAQSPVNGATLRLSGPSGRESVSGADGHVNFSALPAGLYTLIVSRAGFTSTSRADIVVGIGQTVAVSIELAPVTFSSLRVIGSIAASRSAINTSPAAIDVVPGSIFAEQGEQQTTKVLDEIPGVVTSVPSTFAAGSNNFANGAVAITPTYPQLRGALPYETANLIDGHPVGVGRLGTFNTGILSPYMLQDVEVVKGPGAQAPNINYAIGGTVNYRTLEPTQKPAGSVDFGVDRYGGTYGNARATGTLASGKIGYAFDYASDGTVGPLNNTSIVQPTFFNQGGAGVLVNGQVACAAVQTPCLQGYGAYSNPNAYSGFVFQSPLVGCCLSYSSDYLSRNELAKLRFSLSTSSSLTVSYLGNQTQGSYQGAMASTAPDVYEFTPPAGYTGSIAPGLNTLNGSFNNGTVPGRVNTQTGLLQSEFRTTLGTTTLLARYYASATTSLLRSIDSSPGDQTYSLLLYGGIPLGASTVPTIFNGQAAIVSIPRTYFSTLDLDHTSGMTFEADQPIGLATLTASYDRTRSESYAYGDSAIPGAAATLVPDGSGQTFQTILTRLSGPLAAKVDATLSNYLISYTSHYSQDGGVTFNDSTHPFDGVRLAATWRPAAGLSYRFSAGSSIAPPYISLITNPTSAPAGDAFPAVDPANHFYTQTVNSGDVRPETSFGVDLGSDVQLRNGMLVTADLYRTDLHDQFLQTQSVVGVYPVTPVALQRPLYVTQTANLGHSRYEGIELGITQRPAAGFGYVAQASLQRAYAYDLPANFYSTAAGPDTANLGVLPNVNFVSSGLAFNGLSTGRIPYAQGYAEISYRTVHGAFARLGTTYYGENNSYNQPPFFDTSATLRIPVINRSTWLQFAADNIFGVYNQPYYNLFDGIGVPLVNGKVGIVSANSLGPTSFTAGIHVQF